VYTPDTYYEQSVILRLQKGDNDAFMEVYNHYHQPLYHYVLRFVKSPAIAEDVEGYKNNGHGGGDWLLAHDFVQAVAQQNPQLLTSTIDESIESHIMGFMAEESRKKNKFMNVVL
jgi:hypothetical protein